MNTQTIERVHESLRRCTRNPRFLSLFYTYFFDASPEVAEKFGDTDMQRQQRLLEATLYTGILAAEEIPYATATIRRLGERHRDLGIGRPLYNLWLNSLLQAVDACDEAYDAEVEAAWREVMQSSIEKMLAAY